MMHAGSLADQHARHRVQRVQNCVMLSFSFCTKQIAVCCCTKIMATSAGMQQPECR